MTTIVPEERQNCTNGRAGPPSSNSTRSYWHRDPSKRLLGHRTTDALPSTADVVIIGSGITGTFAARELVGAHQSIVMLEAREACWGATGRVRFLLHAVFPALLKDNFDTSALLMEHVEWGSLPTCCLGCSSGRCPIRARHV
jgi:hypothetical protein